MTNEAMSSGSVDFSGPELELVMTALRFLLAAEEDPQEIERLKLLIERLSA